MAKNEVDIPASSGEVWEVLVDPYAYVKWVVGGRTIRRVEDTWPQPGSAFHHTVGMWPLVLADKTKVLELRPPERIVLEARARPTGIARVEITLHGGDGGGTRLVLVEELVSGPARLVPRPVMEILTRTRNAESLRRLRNLVEERSRAAG